VFSKFIRGGNFELLKSSIEEGINTSVFGLNLGEKLALVGDSAFLFYVVESEDNAATVIEKLQGMGRAPRFMGNVLDPLDSDFESSIDESTILRDIVSGKCDTLVITPVIIASRFPDKSRLASIQVSVGDTMEMSNIGKLLSGYGYRRVDIVSSMGEYALRGDVLDVYPLGGEPIRIMTDFDVVESIRKYNLVTLLTSEAINSCEILSGNLINVSGADIEDVYAERKIKHDDLYHDLISGEKNDPRLIVFDKGYKSTIFDYADDAVIVFDGAKGIYDKLEKYISEYNARLEDSSLRKIATMQSVKNCLNFPNNHTLVAFHYINQNNRIFAPKKVFNIRTLPAVNYTGNSSVLRLDIDNFLSNGYTVILCAGSNENTNRLTSQLGDLASKARVSGRISQCDKGLNIVSRKYPLDIILPEEKLAVISDTSLFGRPRKIIGASNALSFLDGQVPEENDYVVHNTHGIGRCLGVKTLTLGQAPRDYVVIEYKNSDKVYLPVENMNQISKYVGSDKAPTINKLGGTEFAKTKERVKSAVKKMAFDLVALYRERMNKEGFKYSADDEMQIDFERSFGFDETVDQLKAINDCKSDMESGKVMDRLVCGDVGFGKTEVALRIAFKTILGGKQVALMCPTTILSEQHFNTAKARMSSFGVKIAVLNRLCSSQDEARIKKDFSDGKIDMLCGTHKLLSSDINYNNLGLLVLDEEQKFGVSDKEKIKNFKKNINVLTLSATPIPRTLNMSLMGVRDISVIETPPVERLPSDVQVVEYNEHIIRSAIARELERNGQVLVIYNKVEKIYNFASRIKMLSPEDATISVAHGQMDKKELEKEIFNLYNGKTQVLVATTLIENGVDLPNANTLIVINADMLGLSQLYQLKGRIGRSDKYSYAYFTFDNRKELNENAYKRLQAIKEFSQMGSGFKIAMRDLEIRGAGSLLGAEQSGHIEKIGYNMYVDLISESVSEIKGEKVTARTDIKVETMLPAFLPHDLEPSTSRRMAIYREISNIETEETATQYKDKIIEIYGYIPQELDNLIEIAWMKNYLSKLGVVRLVAGKTSKIYLESREFLNANITKAVAEYGDSASIEVSTIPCVVLTISSGEQILDGIAKFVRLLGDF